MGTAEAADACADLIDGVRADADFGGGMIFNVAHATPSSLLSV
jgi:hypothetical protein